jgi:site-specific DNA recombinase
LVTDDTGQRLVPHHASKKGHDYHYYVSQRLKSGDQKQGWRIPAKVLEDLVQMLLTETLGSGTDFARQLGLEGASASTISAVIASAKTLSDQISNGDHIERKTLFRKTIRSIVLSDKEITISLATEALGLAAGDQDSITITRPLTIKRRGQEMKMVIGGEIFPAANKNPGLIKLVAKAHALRSGLEDDSISSILEFATLHKIDHGDAKRMLPLGYLAPDIVEDILSGHQPADLTTLQLKSGYDLPVMWTEQRARLGFPT